MALPHCMVLLTGNKVHTIVGTPISTVPTLLTPLADHLALPDGRLMVKVVP